MYLYNLYFSSMGSIRLVRLILIVDWLAQVALRGITIVEGCYKKNFLGSMFITILFPSLNSYHSSLISLSRVLRHHTIPQILSFKFGSFLFALHFLFSNSWEDSDAMMEELRTKMAIVLPRKKIN